MKENWGSPWLLCFQNTKNRCYPQKRPHPPTDAASLLRPFMPCVSLSLGQCGVGLLLPERSTKNMRLNYTCPWLWNPFGL